MQKKEVNGVDEFRVDVGRADKGRTFIRVVHLPSGKERVLVGLDQEDPQAVAKRLIEEIRHELALAMATK